LIYKCGGIDKRTIEKFEKVRISLGEVSFLVGPAYVNRWRMKYVCPMPTILSAGIDFA